MKKNRSLIITVVLITAVATFTISCGGGDDKAPAAKAAAGTEKAQKGGTIKIGDKTWNVVPSMQCGIYPGNVVAISGHAASDPQTEIVVDFDPNSNLKMIRIGPEMGDQTWSAKGGTVQGKVDGKTFSGVATFRRGQGMAMEVGKFKLSC